MAVEIGQIKPGAVFRFKTAARRVTSLSKPLGAGFDVNWEYADGKKRGGRLTGSQWVHYFKADAIEQIPDPVAAGGVRRLRSGREVPSLAGTVNITMTTHCPAKWAIVDLETGELWGHDGTKFHHLTSSEASEVSDALNLGSGLEAKP